MLRDLHFIRELMSRIKDKLGKPKNYQETGLIARREFAEWLKTHPELSGE